MKLNAESQCNVCWSETLQEIGQMLQLLEVSSVGVKLLSRYTHIRIPIRCPKQGLDSFWCRHTLVRGQPVTKIPFFGPVCKSGAVVNGSGPDKKLYATGKPYLYNMRLSC